MTRPRTLGRLSAVSIEIVLGGVVAFVLLTWLALEAGGVVILETEGPDDLIRSTRVWFATPDEADIVSDGELWIEAGTPENGWYVDVQRNETLTVASPSATNPGSEVFGRFLARPMPDEWAHLKIRALLREKYGLRDWWVATVFDTSHSVAVRLIPITPELVSEPTSVPIPTDATH